MAQRARVSRVELVQILRAGAEVGARKTGSPLDCPYKAHGGAGERLRVAAWMRGYTRAARGR